MQKVVRRTVLGFFVTIVVGAGVLVMTNPSRSDWIQWNMQRSMDGYASGEGNSYSQVRDAAMVNPYQNDVLFSLGTVNYATGDMGYVGILGHWIEAQGPSTKLTDQGRVTVKDPYMGFWGWIYKTFHPSSPSN